MKNNLKTIILILFTLTYTSCAEQISHSGTLINLNDNINNFKTKEEILNNFGIPNYIDSIEKKYFYYSEKKISKNFYDNKIIYRKLLVFTFYSNDKIKSIDEYNINNQNQIKLIKDQTESDVIERGLLEKVFGGVGRGATPPTSP